jgi:hypothetical protein
VIFTGGSYASLEDAQAKAVGNSTTAGFFAFTNASNETVLYFDSNGTLADGSTLIANLGTAATNLGTADFVFTGTIASSDTGTPTNSSSIVDLTAAGNTFPFNALTISVQVLAVTTSPLLSYLPEMNLLTASRVLSLLTPSLVASVQIF